MTKPSDASSIGIPNGRLALEPLEGEAPATPAKGRARFTAETRSGESRRKQTDRREQPRFQDDRRQAADRRPKVGWDRAKP